MPPKRNSASAASTSNTPAIKKAATRQLVVDSVTAALKAQSANMENADNTNRNPEPIEAPVARKCSYKVFMSFQAFSSKGLEGADRLIRWFERTESVFSSSNCTEDCKELTTLCPTMVSNSEKMIETFIGGLPQSIKRNVTTSKTQTLEEAINIAQMLMDQGTTLNLLIQPFEIDLMLIKLGSFDVIVGMDWLSKYHARIICDEKVVHIPLDDETLIIRGDQTQTKALKEENIKAENLRGMDKVFEIRPDGTRCIKNRSWLPLFGVIRFGKQGKLNPQYIGPFKILERIGPVYKLELPEELSNIHSTFYISNLKKCLFDKSLVIPMKELQLDDKLNFVEKLVEIMDRKVKQLKQSRIPIVKVRWNSKRRPKFTWEREDQIRAKLEPMIDKENPKVEKIDDISLPVNVIEEEEESTEDDYELRIREKGKYVEEIRNSPSPTTIRSHRIPTILESLGTSTAWVILFGKIPTVIPATMPIVDTPVVHDDTPLILTETPTIPPADPYKVTVARWRSRVAVRSSPPSPPIHQILPTSPGLPRRTAILILLGHLIPFGHPYRTQPNGVCKMLTKRKRVRALLSGRLASRYPLDHSSVDRFSLDDSSLDSPSDSPSGYSSGHSIPDSYFETPDDSIGESYDAYSELDIDSDVQPNSDAAAAAMESDVRVKVTIGSDKEDEAKEESEHKDRGTIKIGEDKIIKDVQRDQRHRMLVTSQQSAVMLDKIRVLERDNMRLRGMLCIERESELTVYDVTCHRFRRRGGDGNGNLNVNVRGVVPDAREYTYQDFLKYQPLIFKGNEGVVVLIGWFQKMKTIFHISNCLSKYQAGYYWSDCLKLKNKNHRNRIGNKLNEARGRAYALGGGGANPDSTVVTDTFLLNNHYARILFDLGPDRSFVLTTFSVLLDIVHPP
uniref:Putative reverse transcriptase domain-containing protein n=1 Tax=Tanacetum cinerariifolium TaxID=118510 RepID=A0A6L2J8J0_TANCI|nr:putative reverse transcriptase domain-containing protein [Tanacetum cinerariifolium]